MEKIVKTQSEWKQQLTDEVYRITRENGTERAFTGVFHDCQEEGVYVCACCELPLFDSTNKFDSGTGWPSYTKPQNAENITTKEDQSFFMMRTEVLCTRCDAHLGHLFTDGPLPEGTRYCINSASLNFKKS